MVRLLASLAHTKSDKRAPRHISDKEAFHRLCNAGDVCLQMAVAYDEFANGFFAKEAERRIDGWYMAAIEYYWMALRYQES